MNGSVVELLLSQVVRGVAVLQAGFQSAHIFESRLYSGFRDFHASFDRVQFRSRQNAFLDRLLRAGELAARFVAGGDGSPYGCNLLIGRNSARTCDIDPELGFGL